MLSKQLTTLRPKLNSLIINRRNSSLLPILGLTVGNILTYDSLTIKSKLENNNYKPNIFNRIMKPIHTKLYEKDLIDSFNQILKECNIHNLSYEYSKNLDYLFKIIFEKRTNWDNIIFNNDVIEILLSNENKDFTKPIIDSIHNHIQAGKDIKFENKEAFANFLKTLSTDDYLSSHKWTVLNNYLTDTVINEYDGHSYFEKLSLSLPHLFDFETYDKFCKPVEHTLEFCEKMEKEYPNRFEIVHQFMSSMMKSKVSDYMNNPKRATEKGLNYLFKYGSLYFDINRLNNNVKRKYLQYLDDYFSQKKNNNYNNISIRYDDLVFLLNGNNKYINICRNFNLVDWECFILKCKEQGLYNISEMSQIINTHCNKDKKLVFTKMTEIYNEKITNSMKKDVLSKNKSIYYCFMKDENEMKKFICEFGQEQLIEYLSYLPIGHKYEHIFNKIQFNKENMSQIIKRENLFKTLYLNSKINGKDLLISLYLFEVEENEHIIDYILVKKSEILVKQLKKEFPILYDLANQLSTFNLSKSTSKKIIDCYKKY